MSGFNCSKLTFGSQKMKIYIIFTCILLWEMSHCATISRSRQLTRRRGPSYQDYLLVKSAIRNAPRDARLVSFRSNGPITSERLLKSLVDNATLIRENIVGGFNCSDRVYGYYADTNNGCQIFHLCVNLHQLYPDFYRTGDFYQFSFICPMYTIFTQDAMVCAWKQSAIPCEVAPDLYYLNNNFFSIPSSAVDFRRVRETDNEDAN